MAIMIGAGNRVAVYAISGDTPEVAVGATPLMLFEHIEKNNFTGTIKQNNLTLTCDNLLNDDVLGAFIKEYLSESADAESTDIKLEDNSSYTIGSSSADPRLVIVAYVGIAGGYRQLFTFTAELTSDSGTIATAGGQVTRRTIGFKAVRATKAVTIPTANGAVYPTSHVTLPGTASSMAKQSTIAVNTIGVEEWLTKGSETV